MRVMLVLLFLAALAVVAMPYVTGVDQKPSDKLAIVEPVQDTPLDEFIQAERERLPVAPLPP